MSLNVGEGVFDKLRELWRDHTGAMIGAIAAIIAALLVAGTSIVVAVIDDGADSDSSSTSTVPPDTDPPDTDPPDSDPPTPFVLNVYEEQFDRSQWRNDTEKSPDTSDNQSYNDLAGGSSLVFTTVIKSESDVRAGLDVNASYLGECWVPSEMGALRTVQFDYERQLVNALSNGEIFENDPSVSESPILRQNEVFYRVDVEIRPQPGTYLASTGSEKVTGGPYEASDFFGPQEAEPDFGPDAAPICFGLLRTLTTAVPGGLEYNHQLDNFGIVATGAT